MAIIAGMRHDHRRLSRRDGYALLLLVALIAVAMPEATRVSKAVGPKIEHVLFFVAVGISFAGLLVRWLSVGFFPSTPDAETLDTTGMHSLVRHPLHVGNFLAMLGVIASVKVWWLFAIFSVGYWLYVRRAVVAEEAVLETHFGDDYRAWAAKTPAFLPKFGGWRAPTGRFLPGVLFGREYNGVLAVCASFSILEFVSDAFVMGTPVETWVHEDVAWVALGAASVALYFILPFFEKRQASKENADADAVPMRASRRFRFWRTLLIAFVSIETCDTAALMAWSAMAGTGLQSGIFAILASGVVENLAVGLVIVLPTVGAIYLFRRAFQKRAWAVAAHAGLFVVCFGLVFNEFAEATFWNEFDSRYNSIAVNYIFFPREVIGNIRESFPLGILLPVVLALSAGLYLFLRPSFSRALASPIHVGERRRALAMGVASAAVAGAVFVADLPSRFANREVAEIATNAYHSLVRAAVTNDEKFDGLYLSMPDDEALALTRRMVARDGSASAADGWARGGLWRTIENPGPARPLNVVLVFEESFGSVYVDGHDNKGPEKTSPNLSALIEDGIFFSNVYATGNRTVRALEAILASFPPIPGASTVRRPGSAGMNSLPALMRTQGYRTAFLYGGLATFDNMGTFWSSIGFEDVWDQRDIADPGFATIWGVADEYLFTEALRRMDRNATGEKPFFLGMLTVSNHRPYVYPDGRIAKPSKQKRRENSATYADWAFGDFIRRAKDRAWFNNTVFVFVGDHGPRVYGAAVVPVPSYRVPLLFYSPGNLAPRRIETAGSSMDVGPTLFGLLGLSYDSPFFGVDLTRVPPDKGRVVMEHNYAIALGLEGKVAAILPGRDTRGYDMKLGPYGLTPTATPDPDVLKGVIGMTQTAHRLFYGRAYHDLLPATN